MAEQENRLRKLTAGGYTAPPFSHHGRGAARTIPRSTTSSRRPSTTGSST